MRRLLLLAAVVSSAAAMPMLDIPHGRPSLAPVPNLLLALAVTADDVQPAHRGEYDGAVAYDGYFNHRLCYRYGTHFTVSKCGGQAFSGNLLNWGAMSTLDLLRLGLTGGDRAVDTPGETVLQRAWLPVDFPVKAIGSAAATTPFTGEVFVGSCRDRIVFARTAAAAVCDGKGLGEFKVSVEVCGKADSETRSGLCVPYRDASKPEGAIQLNRGLLRIGAMGYLTEYGTTEPNLYGGVLRAPIVDRVEWDTGTGVLAGGGVIHYLNALGRDGVYKRGNPGAELFYEGLRYLQGRAPSAAIPALASDGGLPVWNTRPNPSLSSCQRNVIGMVGPAGFINDRYLPGNTDTSGLDQARAVEHGFDVMQAMRETGGSSHLAGAALWAYAANVETLALELVSDAVAPPSVMQLAARFGGPEGQEAYFPHLDASTLTASVHQMFAIARHPRVEMPGQAVAVGGTIVQTSYNAARATGNVRRYSGDGAVMWELPANGIGETVHSVPAAVGAPAASIQGSGYPQFHLAFARRRAAVYVGAGDRMMHALDLATGVELFAYARGGDASAGHGEALVRGKWRTVLAAGMGTGARGVYALDVTDPSRFGSGFGALWEFTERDDASIGFIRAAPAIARFRVGTSVKYFVVVTSGLNAGKDNRGALFLLSLDRRPGERWKPGVNYYKLATPASHEDRPNALSPPALVPAPDGTIRFAYAGDLQGNLWRFDFTGKPSAWAKAVGPGPKIKPLFVALDADGVRQPIANAPRVVFAPGGGYLILFGTGRFIENADMGAESFGSQSFYAVRDSLQDKPVLVEGRHELARRVLARAGPYTITGVVNGALKGWYFDFPNSREHGERSAGTPLLASGAAIIDTLAPGADPCLPPVIRSYVVDAVSGLAHGADGLASVTQSTGDVEHAAIYTAPLLMQLSSSTSVALPTGTSVTTRTLAIVRPGAHGKPAPPIKVTTRTPSGRLGWREIANWQELHDKATRQGRGK